MSRESELQAEIDSKTKNYERIKTEKEEAEAKMRKHIQNVDLADKIDYVQKCLKSTGTEHLKETGWAFIIGKIGNGGGSFIQFKNEWNIGFPNDPNLFDEVIERIYNILENKKQKLKEDEV